MFIPGAQTEVASLSKTPPLDRRSRSGGASEVTEGRSFAEELDGLEPVREAPEGRETRETRETRDTSEAPDTREDRGAREAREPRERSETKTRDEQSEEPRVPTTNREASPAGGAESEAPVEGVELDPNSDQVIPVAGALPGHSQPLEDLPVAEPGASPVVPTAPPEGGEEPGADSSVVQPVLSPEAAGKAASAAAQAATPSGEARKANAPTTAAGVEAAAPGTSGENPMVQDKDARGQLAASGSLEAESGAVPSTPVRAPRAASESTAREAKAEISPGAVEVSPEASKGDGARVAPAPTGVEASAPTSAASTTVSPTAPTTSTERSSVQGSSAAAPATATSGPVSAEDASSVLQQIRVHLTRGSSRATLNLHPSELGRVSIQLSMNGSKLAAVVVAETPEAVAMLDHQLPELRSTLAQNGIEAESLEVQLGFQNEGGDAERSHSRDASQRDGQRSVVAQVEVPEELADHNPSTVTDTSVDTLA